MSVADDILARKRAGVGGVVSPSGADENDPFSGTKDPFAGAGDPFAKKGGKKKPEKKGNNRSTISQGWHLVSTGLGATGAAGMRVANPILTEAQQLRVQAKAALPGPLGTIADVIDYANPVGDAMNLLTNTSFNSDKAAAEMKAAGTHGFRLGELINPQKAKEGQAPISFANPTGRPLTGLAPNLVYTGVQLGGSIAFDPMTWLSGGTKAIPSALLAGGKAYSNLSTAATLASGANRATQVAKGARFARAVRMSPTERATELIAKSGGATKATDEVMAAAKQTNVIKQMAAQDPAVAKAFADVGMGSERVLTFGTRAHAVAIPGTEKIMRAADKLWVKSTTQGPVTKISDLIDKRGFMRSTKQELHQGLKGDLGDYRQSRINIELTRQVARDATKLSAVWNGEMLDNVARIHQPDYEAVRAGETGFDDVVKAANKDIQANQRRIAHQGGDRGAAMAKAAMDPNAPDPTDHYGQQYKTMYDFVKSKLDETLVMGDMVKKDPKTGEVIDSLAKSFNSLPSQMDELAEKALRQGHHYGGKDAIGLLLNESEKIVKMNATMKALIPLYDDGIATSGMLAMSNLWDAALGVSERSGKIAHTIRGAVGDQEQFGMLANQEREAEEATRLKPLMRRQARGAKALDREQALLVAENQAGPIEVEAQAAALQGRAAQMEDALATGRRSIPKALLEEPLPLAGETVISPVYTNMAKKAEIDRLQNDVVEARKALDNAPGSGRTTGYRAPKARAETAGEKINPPADLQGMMQGLAGRPDAEARLATAEKNLADAKAAWPEAVPPKPTVGEPRTLPAPVGLQSKPTVKRLLSRGADMPGVDAYGLADELVKIATVAPERVSPESAVQLLGMAKAARESRGFGERAVQHVLDMEAEVVSRKAALSALDPMKDPAAYAASRSAVVDAQQSLGEARRLAAIPVDPKAKNVLPYINPRSTKKTLSAKSEQLFGIHATAMNQVYNEVELAFVTSLERMAALAKNSPLAKAKAYTAELANAEHEIRIAGAGAEEARMIRAAHLSNVETQDLMKYKAEEEAIHGDVLRSMHLKMEAQSEVTRASIDAAKEELRPEVVKTIDEALKRPGVGEEFGKIIDASEGKTFAERTKRQAELLSSDAFGGIDMNEAFLKTASIIERDQLIKMSAKGYVDPKMFQFIARTTLAPSNIKSQLSNFQAITNVWRAWQIARPGFSNRNFYGILMNNHGWGVTLPDYSRSAKTFRQYETWQTVIRNGAGDTPERAKQFAKATTDLDAWLKEGNNALYAHAMDGWASQVGEGVQSGQIAQPNRLLNAAHHVSDFWQNTGGPKLPQGIPLIGGKTVTNPFDLRGFVTTAGGGRVWRDVPTEVNGRLALLMRLKEGKGMSDEGASAIVDAMHFDYGDLGRSEIMLRRYIPFYTFRARNLPLQAEMMLRGVGPDRILYNLSANTQRDQAGKGNAVPGFLNGLNFPLGGGKVLGATALPLNDFMQNMGTVSSLLHGQVWDATDDLASNLGPIYKSAYQGVTHRDTLTHRTIGGAGHPGMDMRETTVRNVVPGTEFVVGPRYGNRARKRPFEKAGYKSGGLNIVGKALGLGETFGLTPGPVRDYSGSGKPR